ncbi:MAG: tetratricopeptide repeat protein [Bacteroidetes bacterium]|nr:tetratricopeptide repeat protein [Bacteroidota bacterium]
MQLIRHIILLLVLCNMVAVCLPAKPAKTQAPNDKNQLDKSMSKINQSNRFIKDHIDELLFISSELIKSDPDSAILLINEAHELSRKMNYAIGIMRSFYGYGEVHSLKGGALEALSNVYQGMEIAKQLDQPYWIGLAYFIIGGVYENVKDLENSYLYYDSAKQFLFNLGHEVEEAKCNNSISGILIQQGKFKEALPHTSMSLLVAERNSHLELVANSLDNMGSIYLGLEQYHKALSYYQKALAIVEPNPNIGLTEAYVYNNIGKVYYHLSNFDSSVYYSKLALHLSKGLSAKPQIKASYENLFKAYDKLEDYQRAMEIHRLYIELKKEFGKKEFLQLEMRLRLQRQEKEIAGLNFESAINDIELQNTQSTTNQIIAVLILLLAAAVTIYFLSRVKHKASLAVKLQKEEIERRNTSLKIANSNLKDFAQVVSHDLKAPLRGIGSIAQFLAEDYSDKLDEQGKQHLKALSTRSEKMQKLIAGVLEYSRYGQKDNVDDKVNLNEVVKESIELVSAPPNIKISIAKGMPFVRGNKVQLTQLFQNLINNAIKYNDKSQGEVSVGFKLEGVRVELFVKDNGPGIERKHFEKIFEMFETLDQVDLYEHTGIGLPTVRKIVSNHGGQIWLESEIGSGATFYFTLKRTRG